MLYLEVFVALFMVRYLRKMLQGTQYLAQWDRPLVMVMTASIALLVVETVVTGSRNYVTWFGHGLVFYLIYLVLTRKEFQHAKSIIYAVSPAIIVSFFSDVVQLINLNFYNSWSNYFDTAQLFAIIWLGGMWFMTQQQRKSREKEKQLALEREKEYRITQSLKAELEVQVAERTAALTLQKEELQHTITELTATQAQLIQSEKMASLGELTAGIAHEIQNPLNFVNNFAEVNTELINEMKEEMEKGNLAEAKAIANDIAENEQKISHHGKRADAIVKGMLQHSRSSSSVKEPTDINALADEYLRLAFHGLRAKDKSFNATLKTDFDKSLSADKTGAGKINIVPQDIGRVILNLITNAFYAVSEKKRSSPPGYEPTVSVTTKRIDAEPGHGERVELTVKDNGNGIPQYALDKIFQPFFTTKPTGQGTGLGLSMSYDIITKGHGGTLSVETTEGNGAAFIIQLPV